MNESERVQRIKENRYHLESHEIDSDDEAFAGRIISLLNDPKIDKHCMVDAYYYDFSVIPRGIQEKLQLWRDAYLIFGITTDGEIISKWVDRWDLDSCDPIMDGKVIHSDKPCNNTISPEIKQAFDPALLSNPAPKLLDIFDPMRELRE